MLMLFIIIIYSHQQCLIFRRHHNHQVFPTISGSDYILYNHDIIIMRMPVQRNAYMICIDWRIFLNSSRSSENNIADDVRGYDAYCMSNMLVLLVLVYSL